MLMLHLFVTKQFFHPTLREFVTHLRNFRFPAWIYLVYVGSVGYQDTDERRATDVYSNLLE